MKTFFKKIFPWVLLIFGLTFCQTFLISKNKGDLIRMASIYVQENVYDVPLLIANDSILASKEPQYTPETTSVILSNYSSQDTIDVLVIGDSFSESNDQGFQKYLFHEFGLHVATLDKFERSQNQMVRLNHLINSGFFSRNTVRYVLMESVERDILHTFQPDLIHAKSKILETKPGSGKPPSPYQLPQNSSIYSIYNNLRFHFFSDTRHFNYTLRFQTNNPLFNYPRTNILILSDDLINTDRYAEKAMGIVKVLKAADSSLQRIGVKMILMPAPNKYTVYYPWIKANPNPEPQLLHDFPRLSSGLTLVNLLPVFREKIQEGVKDLYLFGDTHWGPRGHYEVAKEIHRVISSSH